MKKLLKYAIPAILISLFIGGFAYAATPNFWLLSNNFIKPLTTSWNLMVGNHSSNPTEADGGIYYNTTSKTFQCGVNGSWTNCGIASSGGATSTIAVSGVTNNGPNFTFTTGTPPTGLNLLITSNGSGTITYNNQLQAGYNIPLTASTTQWSNLYNNIYTTVNVSTGTSGTIFNIATSTNSLTINLPTASSVNTGQLSATDWTTFNNKLTTVTADSPLGGSGTSGSHLTCATCVTSVTGAGSILSSGGTTPQINLQNLTSNDILFGQGNSTIATSSKFTFDGSLFTNTATTTLATTTIAGTLKVSSIADCNSTQFLQITSGLFGCGTPAGGGGGSGGGFSTSSPNIISTSYPNSTASVVGINSSTPNAMLVVKGISGSTTPIFIVTSSSNVSLFQVTSGGKVVITPTTTSTPTSFLMTDSSGGVTATATPLAVSLGGTGTTVLQSLTLANMSVAGSLIFSAGDGNQVLVGTNTAVSLQNLTSNDILFGQGTGVVATSTSLTWDGNKFTTTNASTTNLTVATNFVLTGASTGCATFTSGLLSSTGVACGSGGGGGSSTTLLATSSPDITYFTFPSNTQNRVGINSTTPIANLSVVGIAGSTTPEFAVASSSNNVNLVVASNGKVGIGSTTPNYLLTVNGAGASGVGSGTVFSVTNANTQNFAVDDYGTEFNGLYAINIGTQAGVGPFLSAIELSTTGTINFNTGFANAKISNNSAFAGSSLEFATGNATGDILFKPNGNELVIFQANGNVGIGTITPSSVLYVQASSTTNTGALLTVASSSGLSLFKVKANGDVLDNELVSGNCVQAGTGGLLTTTGSACGGGSSITFPISYASSTATTTTVIYSDVNRGDTYTANGSIVYPYKTLATAIAASSTLGNAYFLAPGTYIDGAPDTWQQSAFSLNGNEATYVPASGVTFPGSFDIYDLTIAGNVTESDNSLTFIHQFNNGVISGNLTEAGNATLVGMALPSTTSKLTILAGALSNNAGDFIQNKIDNYGVANFNDDQLQASTTGFFYNSTTSGQTIISGATIINQAFNAGGLNIANGATSSPNVITNFNLIIASTSAGSLLTAGSAATVLCDGSNFVDKNGTFTASEISGSNWLPCYDEKRSILDSLGIGTSTVGNFPLQVAASSTGAAILTVTPAGKVGIGTVAPTTPLEVDSASANPIGLFLATAVSNTRVRISTAAASTANSVGLELVNNNSISNGWTLQNSGTPYNFQIVSGGSFVALTVLQTSDFVGIGTITPTSLLYIQATSSANTSPLFVVASSSSASMFKIDSNGLLTVQPTATSTTAIQFLDTGGNANFIWDNTNYTNTSTVNLLTIASSTGNTLLGVDGKGHIHYGGASPTVSSCGTSPAVSGNDTIGDITTGSASPTACTLTFASAYNSVICVVTDDLQTSEVSVTATSTTAITMTMSAALTSHHIYYHCGDKQ